MMPLCRKAQHKLTLNNMENFNIGDRVRFLNAVGEGIITRLLTANKVMVKVDGFDIPCLSSDIVVIPHRNKENPASQRHNAPCPPAAPKPAMPDPAGDEYEISFALLPPRRGITELWLLNDSPYRLHYCAGFCNDDQRIQPLAQGTMDADSKTLVKALALQEFAPQRTLWLGAVLYKNIMFLPAKSSQAMQVVFAADFEGMDEFRSNDFFEQNAFIIEMLSSKPPLDAASVLHAQPMQHESKKERIQMPKIIGRIDVDSLDKPTKPAAASSKVPKEETIIPAPAAIADIQEPQPMEDPNVRTADLRAVVLRSQLGFMTDAELLGEQLKRAKACIDALLEKSCSKCVLIYGLGAGQTKVELQKLIDEQPLPLESEDASQREYHYGAIALTLKQADVV
jgi:hypothetical protein